MKNGRFTKRERARLGALDAVERVYATRIVYADGFKREFMRRYNAGEKPGRDPSRPPSCRPRSSATNASSERPVIGGRPNVATRPA